MRILSVRKQKEAEIYLTNLCYALMQKDDVKRVEGIANVAELAYIIGGLDMMFKVGANTWNKGGDSDG